MVYYNPYFNPNNIPPNTQPNNINNPNIVPPIYVNPNNMHNQNNIYNNQTNNINNNQANNINNQNNNSNYYNSKEQTSQQNGTQKEKRIDKNFRDQLYKICPDLTLKDFLVIAGILTGSLKIQGIIITSDRKFQVVLQGDYNSIVPDDAEADVDTILDIIQAGRLGDLMG